MLLSDYKIRLKNASDMLGISLNNKQQDQILTYLEQLHKWNKTYNLTAIRDLDQMLVQHIFDSLAVVPNIQSILYKNTVLGNELPIIVDVGSGGGLPGVVLAIMGLGNVHCVDSVEKKMTFVRQMSGLLQLSNLRAHHARIESLPAFNANIVISRAFSSLNNFIELASKHVAPYGCILAMKGQVPSDEIEEMNLNTSWQIESIAQLQVPELHAKRCLISLYNQGK